MPYLPPQGQGFPGNAVVADVLAGVTFSSTQGTNLTGTQPNNGALNYSPSTAAQTIPAGYTSGGTIAAVGGTAAVGNVLAGDTFSSANGIGLTGTMPNNGALNYSPSTAAQTIPAGYTSGGTIAAVGGTAAVGNVLAGDTFSSANGIGLTGTMPNNGAPTLQPGQAIAAGYYSGGSAAAIKLATGSVTQSAASITATIAAAYGGGSMLVYPLSIPVPSGAGNILWAATNDSASLGVAGYGQPLGYADGSTSDVVYLTEVSLTNLNPVGLIAQTGLSINTTAIILPVLKSGATYNYAVMYT